MAKLQSFTMQIMEDRRYIEIYENYSALQRIGLFILVFNLCGIAAWAMSLLPLPEVILASVGGLHLAGMALAVLLVLASLDLGRPRTLERSSRFSRTATVAMFSAAAITIAATSPLIFEGVRLFLEMP